MGVVVNQSFKNTVYTYLGFGLGAINTLFLYTNFLSEEYYGLVGYILSTANILTPLLCFGVQNTFVKFFRNYKSTNEQQAFSTLMFFLPLFLIVPIGIIGAAGYEFIGMLLSKQNAVIQDYVGVIFFTAVAMAYFEVFFAWAKVHMKSVFGNFLKEVFHRAVVTVLLFLVYFEVISAHGFIMATLIMYVFRTVLMAVSAFNIKRPIFVFKLPFNWKNVLKYSSLIILAGSVAVILLDVDKFMIGQFKALENVAFYNVAVFIALVIVVPSRAMHQITYPLTAKLMSENNKTALADLYKRSSLTLFVIGGFIFLLIMANINQLYLLIPQQYSGGVLVVFLIGLAKLFECLLGNNNSILFNSNYYRMVLFFGVLLAVLTIVLNIFFIPTFGINGAAMATLISFSLYCLLKTWFVRKKLNMMPFTRDTAIAALVLFTLMPMFYFWDFPFHPIINIGLKSALVSGIFGLLLIKLNFSPDIKQQLWVLYKKINP